jgi:hypothetical protein
MNLTDFALKPVSTPFSYELLGYNPEFHWSVHVLGQTVHRFYDPMRITCFVLSLKPFFHRLFLTDAHFRFNLLACLNYFEQEVLGITNHLLSFDTTLIT